jgi:hypothetical protein
MDMMMDSLFEHNAPIDRHDVRRTVEACLKMISERRAIPTKDINVSVALRQG